MKKLSPMSLILSVCTLAVAATCFMAVSAPGQQAPSPQRWEYRTLDTRDLLVHPQITNALVGEMKNAGITAVRTLEEPFDKLGADGWELVSYSDRIAVFKRPVK